MSTQAITVICNSWWED